MRLELRSINTSWQAQWDWLFRLYHQYIQLLRASTEQKREAIKTPREVLNCCRSASGAGMRCPGAQAKSGYSGSFILCMVQDQASSSSEQSQHRVKDYSHRGPFSESLTLGLEQRVSSRAKEGGRRCVISALCVIWQRSSLPDFSF